MWVHVWSLTYSASWRADLCSRTHHTHDLYFTFLGKYLADFQITKRQHLTNTGDRIISKVSVNQCAKLCVETETINCASFGYCVKTTECRLSTASMRNVGQVSSEASMSCDVYNSKQL